LQQPGLAGYPNADRELSVAAEVWGDLDGVSRTKRSYGKGTVAWGACAADVLTSSRIPKMLIQPRVRFEVSRGCTGAGDTDIYFVANNTDREQDINARFRVSGKEAELWHADTGEIEPAEFSSADGRRLCRTARRRGSRVRVAVLALLDTLPSRHLWPRIVRHLRC